MTRREMVVRLCVLPLAGCTGDDSERTCATPSSTGGPTYCLLEGLVVRVTGAAALMPGQTVLFNIDDDTAVILARDADGWLARSAICTHACCVVALCGDETCGTLSATPDACGSADPGPLGRVLCPCHGSEFTIADGQPLNGPATTPLPAYAVAFDGDDVLVDTGNTVHSSERFG